eukprot:TRINITY_DN13715_c0_g1_i1.p1 TRINITY_DN13715_c0_g1~~TRINITY_DN13715_c0_g1_i1.p1  ORF type:complete len:478 (-),score=111.39 TRINITY_DN13715_c0_g1_i1:294-1727(-)
MAVSLQCSLLGGPEFVGCGYSPSDDAAEEQIEIEVQVPFSPKPAIHQVLRLRSASSGGSRRMMPAGKPGVRRTPSVETKHSSHQRYPSARGVGREQQQQPSSRRPRAASCEWCGSAQECDCELALNSMVAEAMRGQQSSPPSNGKRRPLQGCEKPSQIKSVETTSTSEGSEVQEEEQDNSQGEDSSAANLSETSVPGADAGVPEVKDWRVRELRSRLSDLLGAPGSASSDSEAATSSSASAEARRAVSYFGGEGACLRRFLKSASYDIAAAEKKLRKTIDFRVQNNVSFIRDDPAALRIWEEIKEHWPEYIIGTTSDGSPVSYFDLEKAVAFCQRFLDENKIRTFWIMWMEHNLQLQRQGRSQTGGGGGHQDLPASVVVYNLSGLGFARVTKCAAGIRALVRVVGLAEEHYPDNLRRAIIVNVPSLFYNCVWPLVTKVLNTETLANITISNDDGHQAFQECRLEEISDMLQSASVQR